MIETDFLKESEGIIEKMLEIPTLESFDIQEIQELIRLSKFRIYAPGEEIIREGTRDTWIYFLVSGSIRIEKAGKSLTVLSRRGEVFGEMGMVDGAIRSASVYAVTETFCMATDSALVHRLTGEGRIAFSDLLYRIFAEVMAVRLRETNALVVALRRENEELRKKVSRLKDSSLTKAR